jgi:hypothetical protein
MKKFAVVAVLATVIVTPFGISSAGRTSDAPECCQKKQDCCPSASCCKGGNHGMGAHCMLHATTH